MNEVRCHRFWGTLVRSIPALILVGVGLATTGCYGQRIKPVPIIEVRESKQVDQPQDEGGQSSVVVSRQVRFVHSVTNVRESPSTSAPIVGRLAMGDSVMVDPVENDWCAVYRAGDTMRLGFVFAPLLEISAPPRAVGECSWIAGEWYTIATSARHHGKIVLDYQRYSFDPGGSVTWSTKTETGTLVEEGEFRCDGAIVHATFDRGESGVQVFSWKQERPGLATMFRWENLTYGHQREDDDQFARKNTAEWAGRGHVQVNTARTASRAVATELKVRSRYRVSERTPVMPSPDPPDPIAALGRMKFLEPGGIFTVMSTGSFGGIIWYRVSSAVGVGWINSTALLGQDLELID